MIDSKIFKSFLDFIKNAGIKISIISVKDEKNNRLREDKFQTIKNSLTDNLLGKAYVFINMPESRYYGADEDFFIPSADKFSIPPTFMIFSDLDKEIEINPEMNQRLIRLVNEANRAVKDTENLTIIIYTFTDIFQSAMLKDPIAFRNILHFPFQ